MPTPEIDIEDAPNLTSFEIPALDGGINLADGHPRQDLTSTQLAIVNDLPGLFHQARAEAHTRLERRSQRAFMDALGQRRAPVEAGRVHSIYASSVGTAALGYAMARSKEKVALLHPTFDNIHDLLHRQIDVLPLEEPFDAMTAPSAAAAQGATALFITTPNNPTGKYLDERRLIDLVDGCVRHDLTLCLDTSFRGFDTRTQFDHYSILEQSGVRYVVIEDTGKLWPVLELKLGFVAVSHHWQALFQHVISDILLGVSPLVLALVERLAHDAAGGGFNALHRLVASNRDEVRAGVADLPGLAVLDEDARVSVARIGFPNAQLADLVYTGLRDREVYLLPCGPFHWARPDQPADALRIALARNPEDVTAAVARLRTVWAEVAS